MGAQGLKPLFIAGSCVTTVLLDLAFAAERYLRHSGRLAKNLGTTEKVLSGLSSQLDGLENYDWATTDTRKLCSPLQALAV